MLPKKWFLHECYISERFSSYIFVLQKPAYSTIVDRLTDPSKFGGTHKLRFDASGKGRGKVGGIIILC